MIDVYKDIPVVFVGFASEDEFDTWFKQYVAIALRLSAFCKNKCSQLDVKDVLKEITPILDQAKTLKTCVEKLRNVQMVQVNTSIIDMENTIKKLIDSIGSLLTSHGMKGHASWYACDSCDMTFNTKRALAAHAKIHKKN
jgi:hypothetical protein